MFVWVAHRHRNDGYLASEARHGFFYFPSELLLKSDLVRDAGFDFS